MKANHILKAVLWGLLPLNCQPSTGFAQGTAFTYQGRLNAGSQAADGRYDLTFSVWSSSSGPGQVGSTVTNLNLEVAGGLFQTMLDFGPGGVHRRRALAANRRAHEWERPVHNPQPASGSYRQSLCRHGRERDRCGAGREPVRHVLRRGQLHQCAKHFQRHA